MADFMVPPHGSCMVKCKECKGLYMPESTKTFAGDTYFEKCPFCGYSSNNFRNTIPIWKYNLIKFFRSGSRCEDIENGLTKFEFEKKKKKDPPKEKSPIAKMIKTVKNVQYVDSPKPPSKEDYYYRLYMQKGDKVKAEYKFYGFVDSMADLPKAKLMEPNSLYYVNAKKKFVIPEEKVWSFNNEVEECLVGEQRKSFLVEAYENIPKSKEPTASSDWARIGVPMIFQQ